MRAEEQFDSFYLKTRRALVHQTFALTGDLAAAQRAVRDAYVGAWHHWRKVKAYEDPRDWVRPRAWALAQRRHTARLWQRTRDLSSGDRAVLDALHKLTGAERRALLMGSLAGVPLDVSARELNVTQETLEKQHAAAVAGVASALGISPGDVTDQLRALGEAAGKAALPRAALVRREGRNRRRTHTLAAAAVAIFLAVGSGAFAHEPTGGAAPEAGPLVTDPGVSESSESSEAAGEAAAAEDSTLPSAEDLLSAKDLRLLKARTSWTVSDTHDNTSGDGLNYVCQQERFADPEGLATLVRTLESERRPGRKVVEAVEISASADEAARTYQTVLDWVAGCEGGNLQLRETYDVAGVADQATLFELGAWARPQTEYSVAVAQVGQVVTTSVVRTRGGQTPRADRVARMLAQASRMICERAEGTDCGGKPKLEATPPPPSTEAPGALATVDMPQLTKVGKPWIGTRPVPTTSSAATPTSCDRTEFDKSGSQGTRTRTFLVPEARLPERFGLTETYAGFGTDKDAAGLLREVRQRLGSCEDRDLATEVLLARTVRRGPLDASLWRLRTELSQSRDIVYDVGLVRRGDALAHLTFVPAGEVDLPDGAFRALLIRAGQRLGELD